MSYLAAGLIWLFAACFFGLIAGAILAHCASRDDEL